MEKSLQRIVAGFLFYLILPLSAVRVKRFAQRECWGTFLLNLIICTYKLQKL